MDSAERSRMECFSGRFTNNTAYGLGASIRMITFIRALTFMMICMQIPNIGLKLAGWII